MQHKLINFTVFSWNLVIIRLLASPGPKTSIFPKENKGFLKGSISLEIVEFIIIYGFSLNSIDYVKFH